AWNINPGPAQWVSTSASLGNGSAGTVDYELPFVVPNCTVPQTVTLTGSFGADNNVDVILKNITTGTTTTIGHCSGNYCFNSSHQALPALTATTVSGPNKLIVRVNNIGGPSG